MTDAGLFSAGADAADALLRDVYRVDVGKALDPLDARDFLVIVQRIGRALRGVARDPEAAALKRALEKLDVDWSKLTPAARTQVIRAAKQAMAGVEAKVLPRVDQVFEVEAKNVVERSRAGAIKQFGLHLGADTTKTDDRIAKFVRESQGNFIRDEYGRRRDDLGERARDVVASGLERGLGRDDIVEELSSDLTTAAANRDRAYWETVAMSFANRGRTYTQLAAFDEADIRRYRFEAVLDEVTSEICRFMHGRVFDVSRAMSRFHDVERLRDPERIQDVQPWVQVGADDDGNQVLFYERGDRRRVVAQVDEPSVGERDDVGSYSRELSDDELEAAGVTVPPLHGRCRSTIVVEE
jgi:SPP1 gp7 family putative phage head morphogenesis protein